MPWDTELYNIFRDARTGFGELMSVGYSPVIELKSNYGLSALRDVETETNTGAVTHSGAEYKLATGATANSVAELASAERGRYQPGVVCLAGLGMRRPTAPTGDQDLKWGYFDTEDGFGFGEDATGVYVFTRRSSTDTKVYQSSWNADTLDGSGPSGLTLDLSKGNIFRMPFVWYGYGVVQFDVVLADNQTVSRPVVVHRFAPDGNVSVDDPNLPIAARAINGSTEAGISMFVAGRQFAVLGRYNPNRRVTSEHRLSVGSISTTVLPMVTFKKKSAFDSVSVKIEGFSVLSDADMLVEVILDGSLTDGSFGSVSGISDAETAVQSDTSATAISGGEVVYRALVDSGTGNSTERAGTNKLALDIPAGQNITLAMRTVSGTGTASSVFRIEEEW